MAIYHSYKERQAAKASEEAQKAAEEYRNAPIDHTKTKEEKDKDAEAAADRFHDRLK